jgi:predicted acyltransferase (DUF342 family)
MVKNLPTVERSTKIRFGKNVPDSADQAENTIVFNASNVLIPTPTANSLYMAPVRNRTNYQNPDIVLLMYDKGTKEITESGESANALIGGSTFDTVVNRANATSNTVQFVGPLNGVSFVTSSNIGISNLNPEHTVSVGSSLYIDEFGSNVLVVSGNVAILSDLVVEGNLTVNGGTTVIDTKNLSIGDAIIEIGRNNTSGDTTLDLGLLMHRPDALSNVVIGFREGADEFVIGYTEASPYDKTFTPKTDEDINVHVYGLTHVDANIYAHKDILVTGNTYVTGNVTIIDQLTISGNTYVTGNVSIIDQLTISGNTYADKDLEVMGNVYIDGNVVAYKDLLVTGNTYVTGNVTIIDQLTISGNTYADKDLEVMGNVYIDGNVVAYKDLSVTGNVYVAGNVSITEELTISNNVYADKDLEVMGNVYIDGNVVAYKDLLVTGNIYVTGNVSITEELTISNNVYADKDLEVMGNVIAHNDLTVTGNVTVDSTTLHVDAESSRVGILTTTPGQPLDVRGAANVGVLTVTSGSVTNVTHSTSKDTGVLVITRGGLGVESNIHATNVFAASHIGIGTSRTSNTFDVRGTANVGALVATSTHISDSTSSTSKTTGALRVTGGVGIQGNLYATNGFFTSNITVGNLADEFNNKYLPMVTTQGTFVKSPAYVTPSGKYVISASQAEFLGNITLSGNATILNSTSVVIKDRIFGIGSNNSASGLDAGIIMEHQDAGVFSNIALIHHADEHRFSIGYTQNTFTDNHILYKPHADGIILNINLRGNVQVQNSLSVGTLGTFGSKVGIGTISPDSNLYVTGNTYVTSNIITESNVLVYGIAEATSKTTGALQVTGGVGVGGDIYATNVNFEGVEADSVTVTDTTTSDSTTSGALKVTGGVSTQENLNVGGVTKVWDATTSTTTTSGALQVAGGVGIVEKLNVGGVTKVWDATNASSKTVAALVVVGGVGVSGDIYAVAGSFDSATHSTSKDTGALIITTGGLGVEANIHSTNVFATSHIGVGTTATSNTFDVRGTANVGALVTTSTHISDTTTSTTTTSGALQVAGGISTQENLNVGGVTKVWDGTDAITTTSGAVQIVGGLGVAQTIFAADVSSGSVTVTDATTSTTTTSGALQVTGGISTQENLNVGGVTKVWDATTSTTTTSGALQVAGGVGIVENLNVGGVTKVWDATTSTTTTSGALQVAGGVGIVENLNVGGVTKVWDTTTSTTTTSGALQVAGGVGIVENLNIGGDLKVDTSVLVVNSTSNRVGINKATPGFTLDVDGDINFTGTFYEDGVAFVSTPWTIETTPDALSYTAGNVGIGEATPDATLHVTGNAFVTTNLFASNVYTSGGLITNTAGTAKKTYSHTGTLPTNATIANATFGIVFSNHVFQAQIYAVLVEGTVTVSSITQDCCGGHITGGTPAAIVLGTTNVIGHSAYPWDTVVGADTTTVTIKAKQILVGAGYYNIFVEYLSAHGAGRVLKFTEGGADEITFNY